MELAVRRLHEMGFKTRVPADLYRKRGYLAGTDQERAAEFMAAWADPQVNAVFPVTGGYGCTRMLDGLDYQAIRANPKILAGFSDITALHLAIARKSGLVTFHSPNLMYGLGSTPDLSPFAGRLFWRTLLAEEYVAGGQGYAIEIPEPLRPKRMVSGQARGRLIGGNLSLISALMGTPYEIQTRGRILFIEDVDERPYRIDRFLSQLRLAGKLDEAAGIILGQFTGCVPDKEDSLSLDQVLEDYFRSSKVPVVRDFPLGHFKNNATLPVGCLAELDADAGTLRLLENPVELRHPN